jgi:ribosome-binding protein aMBF1 (putative translation factor)
MKKGQHTNPHIGSDALEYLAERKRAEPTFRAAVQDAFDKLSFARSLRQAREAHGFSQTQLAELVGTKQPAIARLESGRVTPRIDLLQKIAKALNSRLVIQLVPFDPE